MSIKGTRKIKCVGNSIDTNEFFLHPITLEIIKNNGPKKICPTELHYNEGKPYTVAPIENVDKSNFSDRDIQSYMTVPYLNLNIEQLLLIYKIDSIDSMINWLNNNINDTHIKPLQTINRILMVWIRFNFDELKANNRVLVSIYKKIHNKYFNKVKFNEEEIGDKINNWFKKINQDIFNLDLTEYLFN
jgi:hypothetical protein